MLVEYLVSFSLDISLSSTLSHTLRHLDLSWSIFGEVWHTLDLEQEGKGKAVRHQDQQLQWNFFACMVSLLVLACRAHACGFLVMICQWHGGFLGLIVVLPSLVISWIVMVLWVFSLFSSWCSCSFRCGLND